MVILKNVLLIIGMLGVIRVFASSEVYFSPQGGCEERVVHLINETKSTLDVAIYSLNNEKIVHALMDAKKRGVAIRVLLDRVQA